MNPHPHLDPSDVGVSRPIHFISEKLLDPRPAPLGIAICGPDKKAGDPSGQPPVCAEPYPRQDPAHTSGKSSACTDAGASGA